MIQRLNDKVIIYILHHVIRAIRTLLLFNHTQSMVNIKRKSNTVRTSRKHINSISFSWPLWIHNMIVLEENTKCFTLMIGNNYIFNVAVTAPIVAQFCASFAYFIENIANVKESTDAIYVFAAMLTYFLQYWIFAVQKRTFYNFVQELQSIIDESKSLVHLKFVICR